MAVTFYLGGTRRLHGNRNNANNETATATISVLFVDVSTSFLPDIPNALVEIDARDRGRGFPAKNWPFDKTIKKKNLARHPKQQSTELVFILFPFPVGSRHSKNVCGCPTPTRRGAGLETFKCGHSLGIYSSFQGVDAGTGRGKCHGPLVGSSKFGQTRH